MQMACFQIGGYTLLHPYKKTAKEFSIWWDTKWQAPAWVVTSLFVFQLTFDALATVTNTTGAIVFITEFIPSTISLQQEVNLSTPGS